MNNEKSKPKSKSKSFPSDAASEGKGKGRGVSFDDDDLDSLDPSFLSGEENQSESNLTPTAETQSRSRQQSEQPLSPLGVKSLSHRGGGKARNATQIDDTHRPASKQGAISTSELSKKQSAGTQQDIETKRKKKLKSKAQPTQGENLPQTDFGDAATLVPNDFTTESNERTPNPQDENENTTDVHDDNENLKKARPRRKIKEIHQKIWSKHSVMETLRAWIMDEGGEDLQKLQQVNEEISKVNEKHHYPQELGLIPLAAYYKVLELLADSLERLEENPNDNEAWEQWKKYKKRFNDINVDRNLPDSFNLPKEYMKYVIGMEERSESYLNQDDEASPDPSSESDYESGREGSEENRHHQTTLERRHNSRHQQSERGHESNEEDDDGEECEEDSDLDDVDLNLDDSPAGLRKAIEDNYHMPMLGTVLGYRRCGPLYYQCLVRYGTDDSPTYRIVPGRFAGSWSRKDVDNLAEGQRGPKRKNRLEWQYREENIKRICGVAWKPYDEHKNNPLASLDPENFQATPPTTYVIVLWDDGDTTYETRTSMRRILGSQIGGAADLAIFHKAKVQEKLYRRAQDARSQKKERKFKDIASHSRKSDAEQKSKTFRKASSQAGSTTRYKSTGSQQPQLTVEMINDIFSRNMEQFLMRKDNIATGNEESHAKPSQQNKKFRKRFDIVKLND